MPIEIIIALVAVVIVGVLARAWLRKRREQRRLAMAQQNRWIVDALKAITQEADRKRLHVHAAQKVEVTDTFVQLRQLTSGYPVDIIDRVDEMEVLWRKLDSQLEEYADQSTASTLQSSVLAVRTSKLANEIGKLAKQIEIQLESA